MTSNTMTLLSQLVAVRRENAQLIAENQLLRGQLGKMIQRCRVLEDRVCEQAVAIEGARGTIERFFPEEVKR